MFRPIALILFFATSAHAGEPGRLECDLFVSNKTNGAGVLEKKETPLRNTPYGQFAEAMLRSEKITLMGQVYQSKNPSQAPRLNLFVWKDGSMGQVARADADGTNASMQAETDEHKVSIVCRVVK
jgi:hypothetical protein